MTTDHPARQVIGLFGGSFDPVHVGHIAFMRSAETALRLTAMRLIPSGNSWQKPGQQTPPEHRRAMLELATAKYANWVIDGQEIDRGGASYTVQTLESLRAELGSEAALVLLIGSDQLHNLATWHRYEDLLGLAHIAVTQREQIPLHSFPPAIEQLLQTHGRDALDDAPCGNIVFFRMPAVAVSSTQLRKALALHQPVDNLLDPAVLDYIRQHQLYSAG
ncbi:MAG: nicotinate-nucleotide adenylyltransferase [Burkholderiaceae bacterium]